MFVYKVYLIINLKLSKMKVDTKELFLNGNLFMVLMKYLRK